MMDKVRNYIAQIQEKLGSAVTSERDRRALMVLGIGAALLILYFVVQSFSSSTERLEKKVAALDAELTKVKTLSQEYDQSTKRMSELAGKIKKNDEPLISLLEKVLVSENIQRTNFAIRDVNTRGSDEEDELYEEKSVDLELKKISLQDLVDILYRIQNQSSFLKVSNLNISTVKQADSVNVKLRVSTFDFKKVI